MGDIENIEDIKVLVNKFYDTVREDDLLGPIFHDVIENRWPEHLEKMYRFWQTVLLSEHTYHGSPFPPHMKLPVERKHFQRWVKLFTETIDQNFFGDRADEAKWRAQQMAEMFNYKIDHLRNRASS